MTMNDTVVIPSGTVLLDSEPAAVAPFEIDRNLVTNRDFAQFLDETGREPPGWGSSRDPSAPATGVAHEDALSYARHRGMRLPTEAEWTLACCGPAGRSHPWASDFEPPMVLGPLERRGVFGVESLLLNWEWTSGVANGGFVVRGGPWRNRNELPNLTNRSYENGPAKDVGFRCARSGVGVYRSQYDEWSDRWPVARARPLKEWYSQLLGSPDGLEAYVEQQLTRCTGLAFHRSQQHAWNFHRPEDDDQWGQGYGLRVVTPTALFLSFENYTAGAPRRSWHIAGETGCLISLTAIAGFEIDLAEFIMNAAETRGVNGSCPT